MGIVPNYGLSDLIYACGLEHTPITLDNPGSSHLLLKVVIIKKKEEEEWLRGSDTKDLI